MSTVEFETHAARIDQIDRLLKPAVESLVSILTWELEQPKSLQIALPGATPVRLPLAFPSWISDQRPPLQDRSRLTTALCCHTLQRLWRHRRRFAWLEDPLSKLEGRLQKKAEEHADFLRLLAYAFSPKDETGKDKSFDDLITTAEIDFPDPLTASQVFWVLIHAGESMTHNAVGFRAFFTMMTSLGRIFGSRLVGGASIGNETPSAYVSAKCLAPLRTLCEICRSRAKSLERLSKLVADIDDEVRRDGAGPSRMLPLRLDALAGELANCAHVAMLPEDFAACTRAVVREADKLDADARGADAWKRVRTKLLELLKAMGLEAEEILKAPEALIESLDTALKKDDLKDLFPWLGKGGVAGLPATREETRAIQEAAKEALEILKKANDRLNQERRLTDIDVSSPEQLDAKAIRERLQSLCRANNEVADVIEGGLITAERACEGIFYRQMAYASSKSFTALDGAELVAGLSATVNAGRMDSPKMFAEAVDKAFAARRGDGSWIAGNPFYAPAGLVAMTSDIVWMLAGAAGSVAETHAADAAFGDYVDWLERTKLKIPRPDTSEAATGGQPTSARLHGLGSITGWVSEQQLAPRRVDTWATALAVNALLQIRDLQEERIWEACRERFMVVEPGRPLDQVDPVDLGADHEDRLHRYLAENVRRCEEAAPDAHYSLILHGPPGSSKTAITGALAQELWRRGRRSRSPKMIRVTPADFTRQGEERLDSEARTIFKMLGRLRGVTILFDEIDDLLRRRADRKTSLQFLDLVVPAMLNRLQDLRDVCPQQEIFFVLATNYIDRIEPALIRRGRIDRAIPLAYPDRASRLAILERQARQLSKHVKDRVRRYLEDLGWQGRTVSAVVQAVKELRGLAEGELKLAHEWKAGASERDGAGERLGASLELLWATAGRWGEPACSERKDREDWEGRVVTDIGKWFRGFLAEELGSDARWPAGSWPWTAVNGFCGEARKMLERRVDGILSPGSGGVDRSLFQELEERFEEHRASIPRAVYADRGEGLQRSPELLEELIHYYLGGADTLAELEKMVGTELAKVRTADGKEVEGSTEEEVCERAKKIWAQQGRGKSQTPTR